MSDPERPPNKDLDLLGIGVSVWDSIMSVASYPTEGVVVRADGRRFGVGGGVAVACATASVLGCRSAFVDSLGHDETSNRIMGALRAHGVQVDAVQRSDGASGSTASIWASRDSGDRTIVYSPGQETPLVWTEAIESAVAGAKIFHCNGRHLDICRRAVEVAKAAGTRVSFDGGAYRYRAEILGLVAEADILVVAEHFAGSHFSKLSDANPAELAERLAEEFGSQIVGVTCGSRGSHFVTADGDRWHQPAVPSDRTIDTTGCGDTFHGSFLACIARGMTPRVAAELASTVASINTRELGAMSISPDDLRVAAIRKRLDRASL